MENSKSQQLSIIHWIGIFVLVGIVLLVIFSESDSDRRARIEAEEKGLLAIKKNDSASQSTSSDEVEIIDLLDSVGRKISNNSENQAIVYVNSFKVLESESPAYKSIFKTSHEGLMSRPDAEKDKGAYAYNVGRTEVWQAIFCKPEVRAAVKKYSLFIISANLENEKGEMQSMAVCVSEK